MLFAEEIIEELMLEAIELKLMAELKTELELSEELTLATEEFTAATLEELAGTLTLFCDEELLTGALEDKVLDTAELFPTELRTLTLLAALLIAGMLKDDCV